MKAIMVKKTAALWAVMGLTAMLGVFVAVAVAKPAHADSGSATSTVTAVVFKSVNLKGKIVVTDEHIKVGKEHGCQKFSAFKNSSNVVGHKYHGSKRVAYIDHNGILCRDKHSPTGWVKRGGGATGRDCRNIAAPMHHKMPFPMVKHVVDVHMLLKVYATVSAHAEVHESCGSASGDGSASDWIKVSIADYIRSQSNLGLREKLAATVVVSAKDKAVAKAQVTCTGSTTGTTTTQTTTTTVPTTTTTPPPPSPPGLSCTGPEEISGGGSVIVKCDVSDDNGAQISLNAQSQDSNSQVSGINCFSQGGTPSCQGNGQFEFRVKGINDTSGILTTTVKAVATANGLHSDPVFMTFDVDPSGGGF